MRYTTSGLSAVFLLVASGALAASDGQTLMSDVCGACHSETDSGLSRINGQRKSPEGWMMTIVRMQRLHGLDLSATERRTIVQYLSDEQGLAPEETEKFRYGLERAPNMIENVSEPMGSMCTRCHTEARVGLQRRTPEEWALHVDFHVGNYPTIEYQALGRDREWYNIAKEEIVPILAEAYPLETEAWTAWRAKERADVAGDWVMMADLPKAGEVFGRLSITGTASPYQVSGEFVTISGDELPVSGHMNLYTGFEWRATLDIAGETYRQVLAVSEGGTKVEGRQFLRAADSLGGALKGVRADQDDVILGTVPSAVAVGTANVQVVGAGIEDLAANDGDIIGNGYGAALALETEGNGMVRFSAGEASGTVAHYASVDSITVEPAFTIARVGGDSDVGPAAFPAHFKAVGLWNGPDGQAGTEDDVRIGRIDAEWSVDNLHEHAEHMKDATYAGQMDAMGIFTPAAAGPNDARQFSTNNAGELKIQANAMGQSAEATLIVTVQRFIDPPLR